MPATFEVDWVKVWQKPNIGLYSKDLTSLCVGKLGKIGIAYYPDATYTWTTSSPNLQLWSDDWDYEWGICNKLANVRATQAGQYTVTVKVTFPYGNHIEYKTFSINVLDQVPAAPSSFQSTRYLPCDYKLTVNTIATAESYNWSYNNESISTKVPTIQTIFPGSANLTVNAQNVCGISPNFSISTFLPNYCRNILRSKEAENALNMTLSSAAVSKIFQIEPMNLGKAPAKVHLKISNLLGQVMFVKVIMDDTELKNINIPALPDGIYIVNIESDSNIVFAEKWFIKN